jgi:molybdenum cofactor cytidylyltransferase
MGTSIACAMQEIRNYPENFDAVLIALTDQPLLEKIYFNKLINSYLNYNKNIVASQIKNGAGVPVILGSGYFAALANLDQDFGARKIIANHPEDVILVNPGDKIVDVDTKEAYEALFEAFGKVTK